MVQASTLQFLAQLENNNNREWFHANKKTYEKAKRDFYALSNAMILAIASFDESVAHITAKDCVFRINRDVRFSKNKQPYKTHFGASISAGGRKSGLAGYYLHVEANTCLLAGGIYRPASSSLRKIRQEIDYNAAEFSNIVKDATFVHHFGELEGERVKTAPRGYHKNNPAIELLRYKSFLGVKRNGSAYTLQSDFVQQASNVFKALYPLNCFLNRAIND